MTSVALEAPPQLAPLVDLLSARRALVLTGAGASTESGIPDYRGPTTRHLPRKPVLYREFLDDPEARRRYWARSVLGWPKLAGARPNPTHGALAALEHAGALAGLLTQNVDRLHAAAGSRRVLELHGALADVRCLGCGILERREAVQARLLAANPGWLELSAASAPDGDAELPPAQIAAFREVGCGLCGGLLKPDVVFFGEAVPRPRVEEAWRQLEAAEALLVVGSSLTVFSGFRFVRGAAERGMPVAIVNLGPTRGDALASLTLDARAGEVMPALAHALGVAPAP